MKQKKKFVSFVAGFLTCALLMGTVSFADEIYQTIQVISGKMKINIAGNQVDIDNFVYNDTTYVPLRQIANALDMVVTYDYEQSSVNIVDHKTYQIMNKNIAFLVNGQPVRVNYFTEVMNYYKINMGMASVEDEDADDFKNYVLKEVIGMEVVRQIADDLSIKLTTTESRLLDERIELYENNMGGHDEFVSYLLKNGVSFETYYKMQEYFALRSKVLDVMTDEITTDELYKYYLDNKKVYLSEKVTAKQIFIRTVDEAGMPYADSVVYEKKQFANEILEKIRSGEETFDDMMEKYSQDPGKMSYPGGYTFGKGEMIPVFEETAFALEKGQVSDVVESENGFHIILLVDRYKLYEPFENVKEDIYNKLRNERYYIEVEPQIQKAYIIFNQEKWDSIRP